MKKIDNSHFFFEKVPRFDGFAGSYALAGEEAEFLVKAFYDSDQEDFHAYIDYICRLFLASHFFVDQISSFLILIHNDDSTDLYINNLPYAVEIKVGRSIKAGEPVSESDILDISRINFLGIQIRPTDQLIFCFKRGWKFGLYFDLRRNLDLEELKIELGERYKLLSYKELYELLSNAPIAQEMFIDGWFPFLRLIPRDFRKLADVYKKTTGDRRRHFINDFINSFDAKRLDEITQSWWAKKILLDKRPIIESGIQAFIQGTEAGNINSIKTLYSEIEGILRILYHEQTGKDPSFKQLKQFVHDLARRSFTSKSSLGFPDGFYDYIDTIIFASFDLNTGKIDLSRHSVSHGVATPSLYTRSRALQGVLCLDQIYFYLP
jgi:hypothetical protein